MTVALSPFETARALHTTLVADTEALFADEIDHDEHTRRNRATWDAVERSGMKELVSAFLRGDERRVEAIAYALAWRGQL